VENIILGTVYKRHFSIVCSIGCAFCSKVPKSSNRTPTKIFLKEIKIGVKNAEFYAEYKIVGKNTKMVPKRSYMRKTKAMYK